MSDTLAPDQHSYLLEQYPTICAVCCKNSKKVCTLVKHSVAKLSVESSVQYTLSFITSFFEEMFSQSRTFYDNNMILWYYPILPKVVWKVQGAWMDGYDPQNKDKTLPLRKIRDCYFFLAVYHSKNHVIPTVLLVPSWTSS